MSPCGIAMMKRSMLVEMSVIAMTQLTAKRSSPDSCRCDHDCNRELRSELVCGAEQRADALRVLRGVLLRLIRRRDVVDLLRDAVQSDDVPAQICHVEAERHVWVVLNVPKLLRIGPAVDQNSVIVAQQKPDGHADWPSVRPN